jgi:hypothetical protein
MKFTPLIFCALFLLPILSLAEDITLTDGTELKDVTVIRVEKDGMMIQTGEGVEKYPMSLIPQEVQLVHPYVPPGTPSPAPTPEEPKETPAPQPAKVQPTPDVSGTNPENAGPAGGRAMGHWDDSCKLFVKASVAAFLSLLGALLVGWFIAGRLIANRAQREKQREFDSSNAQQFHTAYMDFFAIWKLWNHYLDHGENELPDHGEYEIPHASRWELLTRTYIAEGSLEAVFLKLSATRKLSPSSVELLGRFRQGFETLGLAIKNNKPLPWKDHEHPDYLVFKRLASSVAVLINGENLGAQATDLRADAFRQITSGRWERSWSSESAHSS